MAGILQKLMDMAAGTSAPKVSAPPVPQPVTPHPLPPGSVYKDGQVLMLQPLDDDLEILMPSGDALPDPPAAINIDGPLDAVVYHGLDGPPYVPGVKWKASATINGTTWTPDNPNAVADAILAGDIPPPDAPSIGPLPGDVAARQFTGNEFQDELARAARQPGENIREYIARLREMQAQALPDVFGNPTRRALATRIDELETDLRSAMNDGRIQPSGPDGLTAETQDYLDYLAANGVDQRTIDDIASGALPMDPASRAARAKDMGLDPDWTLERRDLPLKTDFRGFTGAALSQPELRRYRKNVKEQIDLTPRKEGLVYTTPGPNPDQTGVMVNRQATVAYPLWAPNRGIAGIDEISPQTQASFTQARKAAPVDKIQTDIPESLPDPVGGTGEGRKQSLLIVAPKSGKQPLWAVDVNNKERIPWYGEAETRKSYTEPLMGAGKPGERVLGSLVKDETGLSVAFTPAGARQLRRADLAALDPRFRRYRNLLQGLAPPIAAGSGALAVGAAGSQPRTEMR